MSASDEDKNKLNIYSSDLATEIWVSDGRFRVVAYGLGSLSVSLPPGIYKVKAIAGSQIWDGLTSLQPGQASNVQVPRLEFNSPVPLAKTAQTHEYHECAAFDQSHIVNVNAGSGSAVFAFVRRYTPEGASRPSSFQHPSQGLTLRDEQGDLVADLATQSAVNLGDSEKDPWAACNVEVNPGFYRLRLELTSGVILEQPIIASSGWQTQIFALQRSYDSEAGDQWADLPGSSVFYARPGSFNPSSDDLRLTELAKLGVIRRRQVLMDEVYDMISGKFENPMLGILGGHLLLLDEKPNYQLLQMVVANLRTLLGMHPDVEALALALKTSSEDRSYVFEAPPMLRRSWSIILNSSAVNPNLVPLGSLASEVAGRLWGDSPWLIWMNSEKARVSRSMAVLEEDQSIRGQRVPVVSDAEAVLAAHLGLTKGTEEVMPRAIRSKRAAEMETPQFDMQRSQSEVDMPPTDMQKLQINDETAKRLVYILGIPRANIEEMADKLQGKI